jgi:hypothetical protein
MLPRIMERKNIRLPTKELEGLSAPKSTIQETGLLFEFGCARMFVLCKIQNKANCCSTDLN